MNFKNYSILTLLRKIFYKLKRSYFYIIPKGSLPKRDFYNGLVGCGNFVKYAYVPAFNKYKNPVVVSSLYSRSKNSAKKVANALRYKTKAFDSYEELLNSGIKSIVITVPNHLHYSYITKALDKGLDVFCEKPIVNGIENAIRLRAAVDKSGKILMVGFNERYLDRIRKIKELILQGYLGKIKEVNAFHNQNIEKHLRRSDWLGDSEKSGGGVLHNAGVHLMNVMLYLFGDVKKVSARFENKKLPKNFGEDTAYCELFFKNGIHGQLNASYVDGVRSTYEHMVIKGEKGSIITDGLKSNIEYYDVSGNKIKDIQCQKEVTVDSVYRELLHFYDCVCQRSNPDTDIHDSINTLMIVEAASVSSKEARIVGIDEIKRKYA